jgi:hypothetical protein
MEQLLVLLVLILIPLANFLLDRIRRRYQPPQPEGRPVDMGMRRQPLPQANMPAARARVLESPALPTVRRSDRKQGPATFFRSKREIRRAIIAMVVLGPCRANEARE